MSWLDRLLTPRDRRERMAEAEKDYHNRPRPRRPVFEVHAQTVDEVDAAIERVLSAAARAAETARSVAPPRNHDEPDPST